MCSTSPDKSTRHIMSYTLSNVNTCGFLANYISHLQYLLVILQVWDEKEGTYDMAMIVLIV